MILPGDSLDLIQAFGETPDLIVTDPPYAVLEQAVPPHLIDETGACVSPLITCATVLTWAPLDAGCSQSRNALNSLGLIDGAGLSPPHLSQMRWKTKITQPPPPVSACCT